MDISSSDGSISNSGNLLRSAFLALLIVSSSVHAQNTQENSSASVPMKLLAAGSLKVALGEVAQSWSAQSGFAFEAEFAPSGILRERIEAGEHAQQILEAKSLQLTGAPNSKPAPEGRNTYAWVMDSDQADIFLAYCTNAVLAQQEVPALGIVQVPESYSVGAHYGLTVLQGADATASQLAEYILSPDGQAILAEYGFSTVTLPR